ncbi:MAG: 2-C-methyl-D-erythritol 4-phosphate cytidylyltransferase [Rhodospirillales bacterium]
MNGGPVKETVTALILAAGEGARLGGGPKAFLSYRNKTLIEHAAELALNHCTHVLIGVAAAEKARALDVLAFRDVGILEGGSSRQDTVGILLARAETEWVLIHEAARPFASSALFAALFEAAAGHDAAVPMTRLKAGEAPASPDKARDALLYEHDGYLAEAGNPAALQMPHLYRRAVLEDVYRQAEENGWAETSTAALAHRAGIAVKLIAGEPGNVKLTYPEDLKLLN